MSTSMEEGKLSEEEQLVEPCGTCLFPPKLFHKPSQKVSRVLELQDISQEV